MSDVNSSALSNSGLEFLGSHLQQAIFAAASQNKMLFCFVADKTDSSALWEEVIRDETIRSNLNDKAVTVRIEAETQEAVYLNSVTRLESTPAVVIIHGGRIVHNFQSSETTTEDLEGHLQSLYGADEDVHTDSLIRDEASSSTTPPEEKLSQNTNPQPSPHTYLVLPSSDGRMRLPNNAYDALGAQTQKWLEQGVRGDNILRLQLKMLSNVPELHDAIEAVKSRKKDEVPTLPKTAQEKLLVTRAGVLHINSTPSLAASSASGGTEASSSAPTTHQSPAPSPLTPASSVNPSDEAAAPESLDTQTSSQKVQRTQYLRLQRERENAQKAERERIKAQIRTDREERRRLDEIRKQAELNQLRKDNSTTAQPASTDIRLQVRAFDGSRMTSSFPHTSTIANDVRPWVDETSRQSTPYNLKLILAPMPNRNIEAGEEEQTLSDLGIVGSATMVMVPVKTYVESYTGAGSGVLSTVTGVAGSVIGGIGSLLGFGGSGSAAPASSQQGPVDSAQNSNASGQSAVKVRTLADQRADEAYKRGNELYNGNQLNFQGKKDDDNTKKE